MLGFFEFSEKLMLKSGDNVETGYGRGPRAGSI